jgi:hypothetical protein
MLGLIKNPLTVAGVSAGVMYLFDPNLGKRRRSLLRDKVTHVRNKTRKAADVTLRDMEHRVYGTFCELRAKVRGRDSSDRVVEDRVRSKIGRYLSHPSSVELCVCDGRVTLSGPILAAEVGSLLRAVKSVAGVRQIENLLEVHASPENISALQGGVRRTGEPTEWMQVNWSPTARLIAGTTGAALMINCLAKRTPPAIMFGTAGFVMFVRALTNQSVAQLAKFGTHEPQRTRTAITRSAESPKVPAGPNTPQAELEHTTNFSSVIQPVYRPTSDELIDEASMESFPASDPPSLTRR